jgi:hypothetical protein
MSSLVDTLHLLSLLHLPCSYREGSGLESDGTFIPVQVVLVYRLGLTSAGQTRHIQLVREGRAHRPIPLRTFDIGLW